MATLEQTDAHSPDLYSAGWIAGYTAAPQHRYQDDQYAYDQDTNQPSGFGNCSICGNSIISSPVYSRGGIIRGGYEIADHSACRDQLGDPFHRAAMHNQEIRVALDQIIDGVNRLSGILNHEAPR